MEASPSVSLSTGLKVGWSIPLDRAELRLTPPVITPPSPWGSRGRSVVGLIALSKLSLPVPPTAPATGSGRSLWFCDAQEADRYHAVRTAFMLSPFAPKMAAKIPSPSAPVRTRLRPSGQGWLTRRLLGPSRRSTPSTWMTSSPLGGLAGRRSAGSAPPTEFHAGTGSGRKSAKVDLLGLNALPHCGCQSRWSSSLTLGPGVVSASARS